MQFPETAERKSSEQYFPVVQEVEDDDPTGQKFPFLHLSPVLPEIEPSLSLY